MLRAFDLSAMEDVAIQHLNNPNYRLLTLKISCSAETGYTVATMRFASCERRETKFVRMLKRFVFSGGSGNPEIDRLLADKNVRLIKQHEFPTGEGTVVVLDYNVRKGRQVGI
jgi:hypothetical protein